MQVVEIDTFDAVHSRLETISEERRNIIVSNLAINVVHLNSIGRIVKDLNNDHKHIGNRMEWAFLEYLVENNVDYEQIRKDNKEILQTNPSTEKQRMVMTVIDHPTKPDYLRIFLNGSTDVFLTHWSEILQRNGEKEMFTFSRKEHLENEVINNYKLKRLRVLALGYKDVKKEDYEEMNAKGDKDLELIEKHFVLVCLIVLDDPTRGYEAKKAVADCRRAGINIKVMSGDSSEATKAVAKETGILCDFDEVWVSHVLLEGQEFRNKVGGIVTHSRKSRWGKDYVKNESAFREIIKDLKIISYASAEDKYLLVTGLKNEGFVVGVTGINPSDTKSLLKADIAFTLDELGSEVAKHSSDVILSNDSLKSVVSGIMWGRNLFTNVKRYLQFYLTYVFVLSFVVLIGTIIEGEVPFNLFQLLWLHILTENIALFALVRDRPSYETLLENTVSYDKRLLSHGIWRSIITNGFYEIIILSLVHHFGHQVFEENKYSLFDNWTQEEGMTFTIMFQIFFYFQICNILFAKNIKSYEFNIFSHLLGNTGLIILFVTVIQILVVTYSAPVLRIASLDFISHMFTLVLGLSPLLFGTIVKWTVPLKYFQFHILETPVDKHDAAKLIQNYFGEKVIIPPKRAVKQKWRENSQNQYDTKGKRTVQWADDEEMWIKPMDREERRINIISALRDNETGVD